MANILHLKTCGLSRARVTFRTMASSSSMLAERLTTSKRDMEVAGEKLRSGGLVAFPTETVYGLGANALDEVAVKNIFVAKERPLTDPLIVHVPDSKTALELLEFSNEEEREVFCTLADNFWPGPLTIVAKASDKIPDLVTASTGMVGTRCPNHSVARELLRVAKVPIAAPSANRFGHVSPTRAQHVLDDLGHSDIAVLDGGSDIDCAVGIESTVLKIDTVARHLHVFRRGGTSELALRNTLFKVGLDYSVKVFAKTVEHKNPSGKEGASSSAPEEGPGGL